MQEVVEAAKVVIETARQNIENLRAGIAGAGGPVAAENHQVYGGVFASYNERSFKDEIEIVKEITTVVDSSDGNCY